MHTYSPEVVDERVEDAEDDDEQGGAELGLEADNDHDAGDEADEADNDAPDGPLAAEDEADKEEDEQDAAGELEVHLAVLLLELGQAGKGLGLAHPRVRQHHEQTAHDGQVAQEEVEVEDEAVAERLGDDDADQAADGVLGVPADDDEGGAGGHGEDVDEQEDVGEATGDCRGEERAGSLATWPRQGIMVMMDGMRDGIPPTEKEEVM